VSPAKTSVGLRGLWPPPGPAAGADAASMAAEVDGAASAGAEDDGEPTAADDPVEDGIDMEDTDDGAS